MSESWQLAWTAATGGLTDVGFSANDRFLLTLTHSGRGVFECWTGQRVARDALDDWSYFDEASGIALGIGPIAGERIQVGGLMSGRQLMHEAAGWQVTASEAGVVVQQPDSDRQVISQSEEERACGFGYTGNWLAIATPSDTQVYSRPVA